MRLFADTEHETRTCPTRELLRDGRLSEVFKVRREVEQGADLRSLSGAAREALGVIEDAHAWRDEEERKEREKQGGGR